MKSPSPWTCPLCQESHASLKAFDGKDCPGLNILDECPKGRSYKLKGVNQTVWAIFQMAAPGLIRPDGSFDYSAIKETFDILELSKPERDFFFDRFLVLIKIIQKIRHEKK